MPTKRGFNEYRLEGEVAYLYLTNRAGETVAETILDKASLERLIAYGKRWSFHRGYVVHTINTRFENRFIQLHRFLLDTPEGMVSDHINRDPLDNRLANLRITTITENSRNRSRRKVSTLGIRGVTLNPSKRFNYTVSVGKGAGLVHRSYHTGLNTARLTSIMARAYYWGKEAAA